MKRLLAVLIVMVGVVVVPAQAQAAFQFLPQNDANAHGGWSSHYTTPDRWQEVSATTPQQFWVQLSSARSGGGYNHTYSRFVNGSGQGPGGYWPGLDYRQFPPDNQACSSWMESAQVRVFRFCNGLTLKARRVWIYGYGAWQKAIEWQNFSGYPFLVGNAQWYL